MPTQFDCESWISRIENELCLQKEMQIEFVNMRFTERELRELLLILKSIDEIQKRGENDE